MTADSTPFTPGQIVSSELFTGREKELQNLLYYARQVTNGSPRAVDLSGERGLGKTSIAHHLGTKLEQDGFIYLHCGLSVARNLEDVASVILNQIAKTSYHNSALRSIYDGIQKYVKTVGVFDLSVELNDPNRELSRAFLSDSAETLAELLRKAKGAAHSIFLVFDNLNGMTRDDRFANWLKQFVEQNSMRSKPVPVFLLLITTPGNKTDLVHSQPSLARIFDIVDIKPLSDRECATFFDRAFALSGLKVEHRAREIIVRYSGGLPSFMHEIGEQVSLVNEDDVIGLSDATIGITNAAEIIGRKYIEPGIYYELRGERYKSILQKLSRYTSELEPGRQFFRQDVESKLTEKERLAFDNFLRKMKKLGLLLPGSERGSYLFANEIFEFYLHMISPDFRIPSHIIKE